MRVGVIVFRHHRSECPIADLSKRLPSISFFTYIYNIERETYNARIYIETSSISDSERVIAEIRKKSSIP